MLNWISHSIVAVIGSVLSNKLQTLDILLNKSVKMLMTVRVRSLILSLPSPIASALLSH